MQKRKKNKSGQSQIIGAVLLILLVIISAMIIMAFAVPFVRDKLSGTECLDVTGKIEIKNNPSYTCYDSLNEAIRIQIKIGDIENLTKGFEIIVESGGSSDTYEVVSNSTEVLMYGGGSVEIPGRNEERTYLIPGVSSIPDSVSVYPILNNGKTCDVSDILDSIENCS